MGDLISRQNAIRWVKTECNPYGKPSLDYESGVKVINHLENMRSEQQWIPCSDRLPEEDGDYLVCYEKGYREDYGFPKIGIAPYEVDCEGFGIWQEEFDLVSMGSLGTEFVEIKVDAWMPLPEPFEGGNR